MKLSSRSLLLAGVTQAAVMSLTVYGDIFRSLDLGTVSQHSNSGVGVTVIKDAYSITGTLGTVDWTSTQNYTFNIGSSGSYTYTYLPSGQVNNFNIVLNFNGNFNSEAISAATPSVLFDGVTRGALENVIVGGAPGNLFMSMTVKPTASFSFSEISIQGTFGSAVVGSGTFTLQNSKVETYTQISGSNYPDFSVLAFSPGSSVIPEPSTWSIIFGASALVWAAARRRRSAPVA